MKRKTQDELSQLPDDILISILERLDARTAVATSLISTRWRHLWKSITELEFRMDSIKPFSIYHDACVLNKFQMDSIKPPLRSIYHGSVLTTRNSETQGYQRRFFIQFVSNFLRENRGLRRLCLHFDVTESHKYRRSVDRLICMAVEAGVNELQLFPPHWKNAYEFPWQLLADGSGSSITKLKLSYCRLGSHYDFRRLGSMSMLHLANIDISQEIVTDILQNCTRLESLTLQSCHSSSTNLSIASPDLQLRELIVQLCVRITSVEIFAPKLRRLQYSGYVAQLLLKSVPRLEHVSLRYGSSNGAKYIFENLLSELAHVSNLTLCFMCPENLMKLRLPSPFSNLKDLTVNPFTTRRDNPIWLAALLVAAPFLEKLQIIITKSGGIEHAGDGGRISWPCSNGFQHHHLMDVKMDFFEGSNFEIAFARFLLAKAAVLRSFTFTRDYIYPLFCRSCDYSVCYRRRTEEEISALLEQLTAGIASNARIVFLL